MKISKLEKGVHYVKPFEEAIFPSKIRNQVCYVQMYGVDLVVPISKRCAKELIKENPTTLCAVFFTRHKSEIIIGKIEDMKTEKYWER